MVLESLVIHCPDGVCETNESLDMRSGLWEVIRFVFFRQVLFRKNRREKFGVGLFAIKRCK